MAQLDQKVIDRMLDGLADRSPGQKERILEEYSRLARGYQRRFEGNRGREEYRYYAQMFTRLTNGLRAQIEA